MAQPCQFEPKEMPSLMMAPIFSWLLFTCLPLSGLTQGQEEVPVPPSARSSCPGDFAYYSFHCYGLLYHRETWNSSESLCQEYPSGHLTSLLNEAEASFVATMIMENGYVQSPVWIGLHDAEKDRRWQWSSKVPYLYQAWQKGSPRATRLNYCVSLTPEAGFQRWKDESCQNKYPYLCKFRA
ncbi:lithostathine-1-like [Gracilinanus agilis]|uniref:lithostathine-1-like n=1 Tax=Gracilinanus agilis TaxID=191870 RepID=UPI001CFE4427|nr:lithostathine-1-like [Gracilinanus agilis]